MKPNQSANELNEAKKLASINEFSCIDFRFHWMNCGASKHKHVIITVNFMKMNSEETEEWMVIKFRSLLSFIPPSLVDLLAGIDFIHWLTSVN